MYERGRMVLQIFQKKFPRPGDHRPNYLTLEIYIQIYIPILYVTRMTQNKNDSVSQYYSMVVLLPEIVV